MHNIVPGKGKRYISEKLQYLRIQWAIKNKTYTGHTQKNGAVSIVNTIKTAPLFCVCPVL
jgi:hypothetical protein